MSIALTTATNVSINGVAVEDDTVAWVTNLDVDFIAGTLSVTFKTGTQSGSNVGFTQGQYGPLVTLTVNLTTGAWFTLVSGSGVVNNVGTIAPSSLSTFISELASMRNAAEAFAAGASGILPGTQTAWSSTSV